MKFFNNTKDKKYFEGWYFRHVVDGKSFALIPSISIDKNGNKSCFVQFASNEMSTTFKFPYDQFSASTNTLDIKIGDNHFGSDGCSVSLQNEKVAVKMQLKYSNLHPICGDIMGIFAHLPFLQCRHGIISMRHDVNGTIWVDDKEYQLDNALGYIEMDSGTSFPQKYIWIQANDFEIDKIETQANYAQTDTIGTRANNPQTDTIETQDKDSQIDKIETRASNAQTYTIESSKKTENETAKSMGENASLFVSIATVPVLCFKLKGHIAILNCGGEEYRFATYKLSRISKSYIYDTGREKAIKFSKFRQSLALTFDDGESSQLLAPEYGEMTGIAEESQNATVNVTLKIKNKIIFQSTSHSAGLEYKL